MAKRSESSGTKSTSSSALGTMSSSLTTTPVPWLQSTAPWQPHAYQKRAVKFLIEHAAGALFLDPGLGKTSITLAAIKFLKKRNLLSRVLIVAPLLPCYLVWPNEIKKWEDFNDLRISILHGPKKDEALAADADIYIINPEGLEWLLKAEKSKKLDKNGKLRTHYVIDSGRFKKLGFDTLVVDELTLFKNHTAGRFKMLKEVLGTFARRWGLTGSPVANGLMDLFAQCYILDQGNALGKFITHFRRQYFLPGYDGFSWVLKEGADELIYERVSKLVLRMSAEDYLKLPQLIENSIKVDLPERVQVIYDQMWDDLIADIDGGVVTAANAGVASGKCRQIASGGLYAEPDVLELLVQRAKSDRDTIHLHDAKTDALELLIEELQGAPLLVVYEFKHDLERLQARFGRDTPNLGTGVSKPKIAEFEEQWNRGELPLMFGHAQVAARGLNLQKNAQHICWYTLTWDQELYDQFNRRIWRQGNEATRVFSHHLIAKGTVDEAVWATLKSKDRGQKTFFEAIQRLSRRR